METNKNEIMIQKVNELKAKAYSELEVIINNIDTKDIVLGHKLKQILGETQSKIVDTIMELSNERN